VAEEEEEEEAAALCRNFLSFSLRILNVITFPGANR
jgi:hypothetical protein